MPSESTGAAVAVVVGVVLEAAVVYGAATHYARKDAEREATVRARAVAEELLACNKLAFDKDKTKKEHRTNQLKVKFGEICRENEDADTKTTCKHKISQQIGCNARVTLDLKGVTDPESDDPETWTQSYEYTERYSPDDDEWTTLEQNEIAQTKSKKRRAPNRQPRRKRWRLPWKR